MDFGCGDIVSGIKLAYRIYDKGFATENRADVRYRNFRNDIQGFAKLLEQLNRALVEARRRYDARGLTSQKVYDPLSEDFDDERKKLVGNFQQTLAECQRVLDDNQRLHQNGSNVFQNIAWHINLEQRVDELRRRLHFHQTKVLLVIDRLSIGLLSDLDAKVDDLLALQEQHIAISRDIQLSLRQFHASWAGHQAGHQPDVEETRPEDEHQASAAVREKFERNLRVNPPGQCKEGDFEVPLREGFDALLIHFEQSLESGDQTPDQYLTLLKARWLLRKLLASKEYKNARPGFYYRRATNQVELAILARARGTGLIAYDENCLLALPDVAFEIWPRLGQPASARQDPTAVRANEEEVVRLQLASDAYQSQDKVSVFRRSGDRFRIVIESVTDNGRVISQPTFFAREDRLIPRYALPTVANVCHEMAIFSRDEETLFRFHTAEDLWAFQQALTGYAVSHFQSQIQCTFSRKSLDCSGRVQILQHPIVARPQPPDPTSSSSKSVVSQSSPRSSDSGRSNMTESVTPTTINRMEDGWEADDIKLPALMIYTRLKDKNDKVRFAMLFVNLEADIRLAPEKCDCAHSYDKCAYLCLERPKEAKFPVHALYSSLDARSEPDPNSFDLWPFRLPRPPKFGRLPVKETSYILLRFRSLEAKKEFAHELELRFMIREKQIRDHETWTARLLHRENRPVKSFTTGQTFVARRTSAASSQAPPSTRPRLPTLDLGDSFDVPVASPRTERKDAEKKKEARRPSTSSSIKESLGLKKLLSKDTAKFSRGGRETGISLKDVG